MGYCRNCGTQLSEDIKFCSQCGTDQENWLPAHQKMKGKNQLHCPKCRSTSLTPVVESAGSVGLMTSMTRKSTVVQSKADNRSYWVCQHCGHKFRNLEDLMEEHTKRISSAKMRSRVGFGFFMVFAVLLGLLSGQTGTMLQMILFFGVALGFSEWIAKKMRTKYDEEESQLKKECFE